MYQMAKSAREALKSKARRLASESPGKVDATSVSRPKAFTAEEKTGLQPTTRRAYKKGGAVEKKNWIKDAIGKPGALHKQLGVPKGEKIPEKKLEAAEKKGGKLAKRAHLAETLKGLRKGRKSGGSVTVINLGKGASDAPMASPRPVPVPMPQVAAPPPMQSQMPAVPPPPMPAPGAQQKPLGLKTGGRLTKVAKSYKDMKAGAGSGEGRLQKTDIAKRKS